MTVSDEQLIEELSRIAAEEGKPEAELLALCRGDLSTEATAALAHRAADDPKLRRDIEAFRPLDEATKARISQALLAQTGGNRADTRAKPSTSPRARQRFVLANWALGFAVAAQAAVVLAVLVGHRIEALPSYHSEVQGGLSQTRGRAPTASAVLSRSSKLRVVLRPEKTVRGLVTARVFYRQARRWRPIATPPRLSKSGSVQIEIPARAIFAMGAAPKCTLVVLVGDPRLVERHWVSLLEVNEDRGLGWQRLSVAVELARNSP